jgi:hypothetical protein
MFSRLPILLGALALAIAVPALAEGPMTVTVPFDFKVGVTEMAAGDYQVTFPTPSAVMIQGADHRHAAIVLTYREDPGRSSNDAKLVFQRYGAQYFLWQVWSPDSTQSRVVPKSKNEVELAHRFRMGELVSLQPKR